MSNRIPPGYAQQPHSASRRVEPDGTGRRELAMQARNPYDGGSIPSAVPGIRRQIPGWGEIVPYAPMPPTQWLEIDDIGAIAPGDTAAPISVEFAFDGTVIGITLGVRTIALADIQRGIASLAIQMTVGPEQMALTVNGKQGATSFVSFYTVMCLAPQGAKGMYRRFARNDKWTITVRNRDTENTYTPIVGFDLRNDC
jgi:hypothetical protein